VGKVALVPVHAGLHARSAILSMSFAGCCGKATKVNWSTFDLSAVGMLCRMTLVFEVSSLVSVSDKGGRWRRGGKWVLREQPAWRGGRKCITSKNGRPRQSKQNRNEKSNDLSEKEVSIKRANSLSLEPRREIASWERNAYDHTQCLVGPYGSPLK
jgi:hypothetical protein